MSALALCSPPGLVSPPPPLPLAETLAAELERVLTWLKPHFSRPQTRASVQDLLRALLARVERKNSWGSSEAVGRPTPYAFQYLLGRARWQPQEVLDSLQTDVLSHLKPGGDLVVDETGFLKKGDKSAGVAYQYTGTAGRVVNCQVGVFLAYVTPQGQTPIDRELYVPQEWLEDRERCRQAGIAQEVEFATKPVLARRMIQKALDKGFQARWVLGDEVYGRDVELRRFLEKRSQSYVLTVAANTPVERGLSQVTPEQLLEELKEEDFQRISAGEGSKGPREYDWAEVRLNAGIESLSRWLLVRRNIKKPQEELTLKDYALFLVHAPEGTRLKEMVEAAGRRWAIETCFESAKQEVGLNDYEVRSWEGWYRHMTLCLVAHAFLAVARMKLNALEERGVESAAAGRAVPETPGVGGGEKKRSPPCKRVEEKNEQGARPERETRMEKALPKALGLLRGRKHGGRWPFLLQRGLRG
jgi:SRSO17 transposase